MNKFINHSSNKAHHKDDADIFREQSLRAIRRRKLCSKYLFWGLTILAVVVALFAIYLCVFGI
ncbi:hypothetical protein [uncultured Prevotella sp.]|uniref:hypothetical protein n=1 Tax=uncultured Prevotella sp. TaxID=159272 RepID=UPI0027E2C4D7|nr:hypothetical protein [uncultured Prevotella sp.]